MWNGPPCPHLTQCPPPLLLLPGQAWVQGQGPEQGLRQGWLQGQGQGPSLQTVWEAEPGWGSRSERL